MSDKKKHKERYDWYKANGICVDCGQREAWNGIRCIDCAGKRRERARVRYNALKDNPKFRTDHCERAQTIRSEESRRHLPELR